MTTQETDILLEEESRRTIERLIDEDPARAALSLRKNGALIATQIKYLQRARTKLPSYYRARCILPPLSFEQASSESTAETKRYAGRLCIDLTCGLGVDAFHFSHRFERVVAVERDEELARIARHNFALLGAHNIEVVCDEAERFVERFGGRADLIYVDPARRGEGNRRLLLLEECSPNILPLMPLLKKRAGRIVVKASPLFDVDEAFALLGEGIVVEAVSWGGECKELVIEVPGEETPAGAGTLRAVVAGKGTAEFPRTTAPADRPAPMPRDSYRSLLVPDVAFYKTRTAQRYLHGLGADMFSPTGYGFSDRAPEAFLGRIHPIEAILPYRPKTLKKELSARGIARLDILKKDFPLPAETIAKALGVKQGGTRQAAFTTIAGTQYAVLLEERG